MNGKEAGYTQHISAQFNRELEELKNRLLTMGGLVERQLALAVDALVRGDTGVAQGILDEDGSVDAMEMAIDEQCARILARRQPAASDLRLVIAIGKLDTELARIGDEAVEIARQVLRLSGSGAAAAALGRRVCDMLRAALDALARLDPVQALTVLREQEVAERECGRSQRELVAVMHRDAQQIDAGLCVIWALQALARVSARARGIAEYVIYLALGRDVRHLAASEAAACVPDAPAGLS